jgi:hypothetical protein
MASKYRVWFSEGGESIDIDAHHFEIEEEGVLVFYEERAGNGNITLRDAAAEERAFAAYREWNSVVET